MPLAQQLPNLLSGLRIALVPVLLWLAYTGHPTAFLFTFAFSLCTDVADGFFARRFHADSQLGARLDSWGDLLTYAAFPLCAWWVFRQKLVDEAIFVVAALVAFAAPTLVGLAKFRRITSYHTRLAKAVAIVMGIGLILYLGFDQPRVFQAAVIFLLVEALEEIAITAVLPEWRANVPSFFGALRLARAAKTAAIVALAVLGAAHVAHAQGLPDLVPAVQDVHLEEDSNVDSGDVAEGCATATIGRDLLRLTLITRNEGTAAEELGNPECPDCKTHPDEVCGNPQFVCSPAGGHNHPHYQDFLRYEVLDQDPNSGLSATGGKRSFCLEDTMCVDGPPKNGHTCTNQGINAGCWDVYEYFLGCQYVDVTDLPDGEYDLQVTVDPLNQIVELDETNNVIDVPVDVMRAPLSDAALAGSGLVLQPMHLLRARASSRTALDLGGTNGDPTRAGATLYVRDTVRGEEVSFGLPATGWRREGRADHPSGFKYRGAGTDNDACYAVDVSRKGLAMKCSLAGQHGFFVVPALGDINVRLLLGAGERRFCANYGGKTLRNDSVLVKRKGAPASSCDASN
ncbi:MAG TPA: lysyl oxidase family protein [Myxococcota bacterium]|nr:lysyl oxidase family protein [Myxococcota bacterium]